MTAYIYRLHSNDRPWDYAVEFDFSAEMVSATKTLIPSRCRLWKPELKQWWFKQDAISVVCTLANIHCGGYVHMEEKVTPVHRGPEEEAYATLHLLPSAPEELVKAAYRVMSKIHHPDAGGMTRQMQEVNEAYGRLTRR